MGHVQFVSTLADFLIGLGAPTSLPEDWIILADHDDLRSIRPNSKAARYLRLAKMEALQKHLIEVLGPDAEAHDVPESEYNHIAFDELDRSQRELCIGKEIDNLVEVVDHLRYHGSRNDCFGRTVRADCERISRGIWRDFDRLTAEGDQRLGVVYFISNAGDPSLVKIGFTSNLKQRLRSLQTSSPHELIIHLAIPGRLALERGLHARFAASHIVARSREWFRLSAEIAAFIQQQKVRP